MDTSSVATNEEDGARKQIERQSYWHSLKRQSIKSDINPSYFKWFSSGNYQWLIGCIFTVITNHIRRKTKMIIGNYSFTVALTGAVLTLSLAMGSLFGVPLFKKFS